MSALCLLSVQALLRPVLRGGQAVLAKYGLSLAKTPQKNVPISGAFLCAILASTSASAAASAEPILCGGASDYFDAGALGSSIKTYWIDPVLKLDEFGQRLSNALPNSNPLSPTSKVDAELRVEAFTNDENASKQLKIFCSASCYHDSEPEFDFSAPADFIIGYADMYHLNLASEKRGARRVLFPRFHLYGRDQSTFYESANVDGFALVQKGTVVGATCLINIDLASSVKRMLLQECVARSAGLMGFPPPNDSIIGARWKGVGTDWQRAAHIDVEGLRRVLLQCSYNRRDAQ